MSRVESQGRAYYVVRSLAIAKFAKNGGAGIVVFFRLRTVGRALNAYGSALCLANEGTDLDWSVRRGVRRLPPTANKRTGLGADAPAKNMSRLGASAARKNTQNSALVRRRAQHRPPRCDREISANADAHAKTMSRRGASATRKNAHSFALDLASDHSARGPESASGGEREGRP